MRWRCSEVHGQLLPWHRVTRLPQEGQTESLWGCSVWLSVAKGTMSFFCRHVLPLEELSSGLTLSPGTCALPLTVSSSSASGFWLAGPGPQWVSLRQAFPLHIAFCGPRLILSHQALGRLRTHYRLCILIAALSSSFCRTLKNTVEERSLGRWGWGGE